MARSRWSRRRPTPEALRQCVRPVKFGLEEGTTMSDRAALYAAVCANPDDDAVRLVYADWLEEHGADPERAAFIRTQVAFARAEAADTPASTLHSHLSEEDAAGSAKIDWSGRDP